MSILNAALRGLVDALLYPFRELPALVGLTVVSLATGVVMLLVVKRTSDQPALERVKRKIHACLFEIRLFNDDLRAILRAQLEILRHNATYLRLSLVPMLWMIAPLVLVIAQLQFHYGYRAPRTDEPALLKVSLSDGWSGTNGGGRMALKPALELDVAPAVRVETPGVWVPSLQEMTWRIAVSGEGAHDLVIRLDGQSYTKSLRLSDAVVRRSPVRVAAGFWNQLVYPAEEPLPAGSPIRAIEVSYPDAEVLGTHWMVVFFILSIAFAFLLRKRFKVTI